MKMSKRLNPEAATLKNKLRVAKMQEALLNFDKDPQKEERHVQLQCKSCWYVREYSPQVFSVYRCQGCGIPKINHDGPVPCLCESCAIEMHLCKHCSAEMD